MAVRMPRRSDVARWWWRIVRPPLRDPLNAAMLFVVGAAYYLSGLQMTMDGRVSPLWQSMLMLAVICGADVFRARAPQAALRVGLAVFALSLWVGTSLPLVVVLCDLLYASVLYGSRRQSRVLPVLVVLVGVIATVTVSVIAGDWRVAVIAVIVFSTVLLVPVLWALQVRYHRELADAERKRAEQVARLAELDRRAAVAAERNRMARDLHDVVAGHLSAIAVQSEAVLSMTHNGNGAGSAGQQAIRSALRSVRENSVQALTEMRAMIGLLRGDEPEPRAAPPSLRMLEPLLDSARATGSKVEVLVEPEELPELPPAVDLTGYRIVQEALTNAVKHARDAPITLTIRCDEDELHLDVRNTLPAGRQKPSEGGVGLAGMAERAGLVGGTLSAGPTADRTHWQVDARLPVRLPQEVGAGRPDTVV